VTSPSGLGLVGHKTRSVEADYDDSTAGRVIVLAGSESTRAPKW
jgi:hypothetical protein